MKRKSVPDAAAEAAAQMPQAAAEMFKNLAGLQVPMTAWSQLQSDYLKQAGELWNQALQGGAGKPGDRRFASEAWQANPASSFMAQLYLLNAKTLQSMAEQVQGDEKTRARIRFAVQQFVDAASPSNYLALNPEVQRLALDSQGESIAKGLQLLWADIQRGHLSQTDESAFEVGRNVATSEGHVVFENEFFQLLEYKPLTAQVHERPLLLVPPCINKYYILDLQPENSLIRYAVEQGHRTFVVSWRNPDESCKAWTWDDYIEQAAITAIETVREIAGSKTINTLGFCVGGTILATALAVLAARGEQPAESVTLLTTLIDFSSNGVLDLFVDEASVQLREMTIGTQSPKGPGLLHGQELATTFSFLRPNDLVWNYVVGNYLKGEAPPAFDLLYWNGDGTNLPAKMAVEYLRGLCQQDGFAKGEFRVFGRPVSLADITLPLCAVACETDHIAHWKGSFNGIRQMGSADKTFILSESGHIAGIINPPTKDKYGHYTGDAPVAGDPEAWLKAATFHRGSWWPRWADWLRARSGPLVKARAPTDSLAAAPGTYVTATPAD